jgi:hypothetical protein
MYNRGNAKIVLNGAQQFGWEKRTQKINAPEHITREERNKGSQEG